MEERKEFHAQKNKTDTSLLIRSSITTEISGNKHPMPLGSSDRGWKKFSALPLLLIIFLNKMIFNKTRGETRTDLVHVEGDAYLDAVYAIMID